MDLGKTLAKARAAKKWTVREAGKRLGLAYGHLNDVERGKKLPSIEACLTFGRVYGLDTTALIGALTASKLDIVRERVAVKRKAARSREEKNRKLREKRARAAA